ncbi:MAG: tetratricopeptide repeat protein [Anaerolineae bacterium]
MNTRISLYASRIIEAGWLLAVLTIPLFFNVYSSRTFEPDKLTLLRSIALVMATAWLVKVLDSGFQRPEGESWMNWLRRLTVQTPLVVPTLCLMLAYIISTAFSVMPRVSIFGSYQRLQGTYSTFSYIVIFFLMLEGLRQREQIERFITVAIITSIPVTLYGVLQNLGYDPLPWLGNVQVRIASTMGNSIFVAAYLIMVVPLTIARIISAVSATMREDNPPTSKFVLIPFYVLILFSQIVAIIFTQSRGPWLGLLGGLFFLVLIYTLSLRRRIFALSWVGLALAVLAALIVFNVPNTPLAGLRDAPYIGRLGRIFSQDPTGQVRVLIWEGATELVTSDPARFVIGYGPETMHIVYNPFYPPQLAQIESRNASPDRSHNETWDALVTTGLLGFLAYLALFTAVFYLGLRWLGLINTSRQRNLFFILWLGLGAIVAAGFSVILQPAFFGVALPAGMILGLFAYLVWFALSRQAVGAESLANPYRLLIMALYTAMIAHFIEINFGIAIAATRTLFWSFSALLVVTGYLWAKRPALVEAPASEPSRAETARPAEPPRRNGKQGRGASGPARRGPQPVGAISAWAQQRDLIAMSLLVSVILIVLIFDFYAPAAGIYLNWHTGWLLTFTWVFAAPIVLAERLKPPQSGSDWVKGLAIYAAITIGWSLPFIVIYNMMWIGATADTTASAPIPLYIYLGLTAFVLAAVLLIGEPKPKAWISDIRAIIYPALGIFIIALIWFTNVRVVSADILYKQGWQNYHQRGMYDPAVRLYDEALDDQPDQDFYYLFKGKALLEKAQSTADATQRQATFQAAEGVLLQAEALNPRNPDHAANLARMYQTWASFAPSGPDRDQKLQTALKYYAEAESLSPNSVVIMDQTASAYLDMEQTDKALDILQKSLAIDPTYGDTYLQLMAAYANKDDMPNLLNTYQKAVQLNPKSVDPHLALADEYRQQKEWDKALEAYQRAITADPKSIVGHSGAALAMAQLGDIEGAIRENLEVLKLAPKDSRALKNLALLYRQAGQLNQALAAAKAALESAPGDSGLQDLIRQLQDQGAK